MLTRSQATDIAFKARRLLEELYGDRLRGVYLFGSWARGEADKDSDVDIAVVLDEVAGPLDEIERTSEPFCDLSLEANVLVSCVFVPEQDFREGRYALHRSIQRDGILL